MPFDPAHRSPSRFILDPTSVVRCRMDPYTPGSMPRYPSRRALTKGVVQMQTGCECHTLPEDATLFVRRRRVASLVRRWGSAPEANAPRRTH